MPVNMSRRRRSVLSDWTDCVSTADASCPHDLRVHAEIRPMLGEVALQQCGHVTSLCARAQVHTCRGAPYSALHDVQLYLRADGDATAHPAELLPRLQAIEKDIRPEAEGVDFLSSRVAQRSHSLPVHEVHGAHIATRFYTARRVPKLMGFALGCTHEAHLCNVRVLREVAIEEMLRVPTAFGLIKPRLQKDNAVLLVAHCKGRGRIVVGGPQASQKVASAACRVEAHLVDPLGLLGIKVFELVPAHERPQAVGRKAAANLKGTSRQRVPPEALDSETMEVSDDAAACCLRLRAAGKAPHHNCQSYAGHEGDCNRRSRWP
mmetsp:Transcript_38693/g.106583  ORF Transcript_38693/g.106583 Transcript_38693/m.106583 type:complete len:320 (+) Transcript_38693:226-1185(+)